jgi:hypothetical protein
MYNRHKERIQTSSYNNASGGRSSASRQAVSAWLTKCTFEGTRKAESTSGALKTTCAGGGADAGAVGARRTCRASGEGGRRRVRVVGARRTQRANTGTADGKRSLRTICARSSTCD